MQQINTVVIGGGQAGLCASYYLTQQGRDHVVLERERMAKAWRDEKWDSFTLVTPNRQNQLPGMEYSGEEPYGFLSRQEVVDYILGFAKSFGPPIREGVEVTSVEPAPGSNGYVVRTGDGDYQAENVIMATGTFQAPDIPAFAERLSDDLVQIHSSHYKNPAQLPPGAVLVVGSGQSGCQIAEELLAAGREVYLATSRAPRMPRRYRGTDFTRWLEQVGFLDRTVEDLESRAERFDPNPHVSGKDGGHTINLHQFYRDGMTLLGHLLDGRGPRLEFAPDLEENLAAADEVAKGFKANVDKFIEKAGLDAPEDDAPELRDAYGAPTVTELNVNEAGIKTVIWATGYTFDYSIVDFPIWDEFGYPMQERGVTEQPGLYFVGLHWLHTIKSGLLLGVGDDAAHVVEHIASR